MRVEILYPMFSGTSDSSLKSAFTLILFAGASECWLMLASYYPVTLGNF